MTFKRFFKENFSIYHLSGMGLGFLLSLLYWYKAGQFSDYVLKNNIFLISIWGILTGYILVSLVVASHKKMDE